MKVTRSAWVSNTTETLREMSWRYECRRWQVLFWLGVMASFTLGMMFAIAITDGSIFFTEGMSDK